jgi:TRAP-type C4-dicarboxylate transport system substrate-binding protein
MKQRILTLAVAALIGMAASVPASAQVRLIFASQSNPASTVGQFFGAWAKRVTDASQGTGVVEIREGGTLANFQMSMSACSTMWSRSASASKPSSPASFR